MNLRVCLLILVVAVGCGRKSPVATQSPAQETHTESFTHWTPKTELFVEYPPLVAGQTSRFAIHLTRMDNFKPLSAARVEVRLQGDAGKPEVFSVTAPSSASALALQAPSRPGIFGVDVKPSLAGKFRMAIHASGEGISDLHDAGIVTVFPTKAASIHEHGPETVEKITFLKEQQWTLDFGTAVVEDRQLRSNVRVPGEVMPRSGGEAEVTIPFDGRLVAAELPAIGARVAKGQILASLLPPTSMPGDLATLQLARSEADAALQLARKDRQRAERLVTSGAAPGKRLEEALTMETTAAARLQAAETRLAQYDAASAAGNDPHGAKLFALRAPISGVVAATGAAPGANVKAGETLLKIVDLDTVYVSAIVPESELPRIRQLSGAEMEAPGLGQPRRLHRLVSSGRIVDTASRTFPVIYEVDNRNREIAVHQAVYVRLFTSAASVAPAVPESAIVDDGGRPVIFVQEAGESFLRRPVKLGIREGGYVEVLEGVRQGERVVVRGAHLIRLATMSSQIPAHGHVH